MGGVQQRGGVTYGVWGGFRIKKHHIPNEGWRAPQKMKPPKTAHGHKKRFVTNLKNVTRDLENLIIPILSNIGAHFVFSHMRILS